MKFVPLLALASLGVILPPASASAPSRISSIILDLQACYGKKYKATPMAHIVGTKPPEYAPWFGTKYGQFNISVPVTKNDTLKLRIWLTDEKGNPGSSLGLDHPHSVWTFPQRNFRDPATVTVDAPPGFNDETATEPFINAAGFFHQGVDPWKDQLPAAIANSTQDPFSFGAVSYCREFGDGV